MNHYVIVINPGTDDQEFWDGHKNETRISPRDVAWYDGIGQAHYEIANIPRKYEAQVFKLVPVTPSGEAATPA